MRQSAVSSTASARQVYDEHVADNPGFRSSDPHYPKRATQWPQEPMTNRIIFYQYEEKSYPYPSLGLLFRGRLDMRHGPEPGRAKAGCAKCAYHLWKVSGTQAGGYNYLWTSSWPGRETYLKVHSSAEYQAAINKHQEIGPIMQTQTYNRYVEVTSGK